MFHNDVLAAGGSRVTRRPGRGRGAVSVQCYTDVMSISSASCVAGAGAPGVAGADIIDLDRYMRASVRPSRHTHHHAYTRERLVVDAGGADLVPRGSVTSSSSDRPSMSPSPHGPRPQYCKRYSHDSGLSEDTYVKRKHKSHRRILEKYPESHRTAATNSSERDFRASCERALREQQEQIARVAAICEKLVQPQIVQSHARDTSDTPNGYTPPLFIQNADQNRNSSSQNINKIDNYDRNTNSKVNAPQNLPQKVKRRAATPDSSDVTSSTSSSQDLRRKDKHRTESCKTYNLIMGKLDELNHLFVARRASPAPAVRAPARQQLSSGSVSVCDKKVATEDAKRINAPVIQVMHSSRASNRFQSERGKCLNNKQLAVTHAPVVDIEPVERQDTEGRATDNWSNSECGAPAAFDLDDPLHLYAQAKRLQALHARTRHGSERRSTRRAGRVGDNGRDNIDSGASTSLCALCRGYWRVVGRFLKQQLFGVTS